MEKVKLHSMEQGHIHTPSHAELLHQDAQMSRHKVDKDVPFYAKHYIDSHEDIESMEKPRLHKGHPRVCNSEQENSDEQWEYDETHYDHDAAYDHDYEEIVE